MNEQEFDEAQRESALGRKASRELELVLPLFDVIRNGCIDKLLTTETHETSLRERCIVAVQTVDQLKEFMNIYIENGESADILLQRLFNSGNPNV